MFKKFKTHLINLPGWCTKRKIVIFESDDWGMARMRSNTSFNRLMEKGYPVNTCPYNKNDALESNADVEGLLTVLNDVQEQTGRAPMFTLNNIVANPDFEAIKQTNYTKYYREPFTRTLERYKHSDRVLDLYRKGMESGSWKMQYHGSEHVNVNRWLSSLQKGDQRFVDAFKEQMYTVPGGKGTGGRRDYLDTYGEAYEKEFISPIASLEEGAKLFEQIWGYTPESFIAPCYVWSNTLLPALNDIGVRNIQGTHVQRVPKKGLQLKVTRRYHYQGQRNKWGQRYLVRNGLFEPATDPDYDWVDSCLADVKRAFQWKKPAIISSHRLNYIGRLRPENRSRNLILLEKLLKKIIESYPDVEFMTSDELGNLMEEKE